MRTFVHCLALTTFLAVPVSALAASAPHVSIATMSDLPLVVTKPYDESANADDQVKSAFREAKAEHKRVLIDLGGNWCTDCIVFANILALPEMKRFAAKHFEFVAVNVGRYDTNLQIAARFGISHLDGVPTVLIADANGKLLNEGHVSALTDARHMTPQAVADWVAQWAK